VLIIVIILGGVVVIGGILAAIAVPNLLTAMQRAKQKRTMADLRTVATAVEAYATDKNQYPKVSYDELRPLLTPEYIRVLPPRDGWDHPFRYACTKEEDGRCTGYTFGSAGKDGVFTHDDLSAYSASPSEGTTNFDCDIIFSNGNFLEYPEGVQH
jgi:type II secretory pathway pseudopilin PulG